jgi:hypothetical protein
MKERVRERRKSEMKKITFVRGLTTDLESISSTFYVSIFCIKVLSYFCQSQNVTREKLCKALSYKKRGRKMLMKLTAGRYGIECKRKGFHAGINHGT